MSVHALFVSSRTVDGTEIDAVLRRHFEEVYRIGVEFWLVDSGHAADTVVAFVRAHLNAGDKIFAAALTRDVATELSAQASVWLTSPRRGWRERQGGFGGTEAVVGPRITAAA